MKLSLMRLVLPDHILNTFAELMISSDIARNEWFLIASFEYVL